MIWCGLGSIVVMHCHVKNEDCVRNLPTIITHIHWFPNEQPVFSDNSTDHTAGIVQGARLS